MGPRDNVFNLQKAGGIAALVEAFAYIVGFTIMATLLNPGDTGEWTHARKLSFALEKQSTVQALTILIYVVFGIALVLLSVALHERLNGRSSDLMKVATPFGLIWAGLVIASGMVGSVGLEAVAALHAQDAAHAASVWTAIGAIQDGLGGGVEIVGGVWVLLISIASLRSSALPGALSYLGFMVGAAGILTLVPSLSELGTVFGLGQIIWFAWLGFIMIRVRPLVGGAEM
jgi:hypothetical protein